MNENEEKRLEREKQAKRNKTIIIISFIGALLLIAICMAFPGLLNDVEIAEEETNPPIDPSRLYETKEEGFDILEYENYLKYDRSVYINDASNGSIFNVDENEAALYGEEYAFTYKYFQSLINGDVDGYNELVNEDIEREYFTQQQLYDIVMTKKSEKTLSGESGIYTEYVIMIEYKIHENNGTYRNDILPDASRPQYLVITNERGRLSIANIVETVIKK